MGTDIVGYYRTEEQDRLQEAWASVLEFCTGRSTNAVTVGPFICGMGHDWVFLDGGEVGVMVATSIEDESVQASILDRLAKDFRDFMCESVEQAKVFSAAHGQRWYRGLP